MTEFERALVDAFNRHFETVDTDGIAYRRKQHRFSSQFVDILVDSFNPHYYLAIENKSIKEASSSKLYFTRHFSKANGRHQVERIAEFLDRSGRTGYLAVEVRNGRGRQREAYMVPWTVIEDTYYSDQPGIPIDEIRSFPEIRRNGTEYSVSEAVTA